MKLSFLFYLNCANGIGVKIELPRFIEVVDS